MSAKAYYRKYSMIGRSREVSFLNLSDKLIEVSLPPGEFVRQHREVSLSDKLTSRDA